MTSILSILKIIWKFLKNFPICKYIHKGPLQQDSILVADRLAVTRLEVTNSRRKHLMISVEVTRDSLFGQRYGFKSTNSRFKSW